MQNYYDDIVEWLPNEPGQVQFTGFVFRDTNSLKTLDITSNVLAGVIMEVRRRDGRTEYAASNNAGFVNFGIQAGSDTEFTEEVKINESGLYTFTAIVPPGWICTTNNLSQEVEFLLNNNGRATLVPTSNLTPIGLIPETGVSGQIVERIADGSIIESSYNRCDVTLRDANTGSSQDVVIDDHGFYSVSLPKGKYVISVLGKDKFSELYEYEFEVGDNPVALFPIYLNEDRESITEVIDELHFDDINKETTKVPYGYHGFVWDGFVCTERSLYNANGYHNTNNQNAKVIYNGSGFPTHIVKPDNSKFDLLSLDVATVSLIDTEGDVLIVEVYIDGEVKYRDKYKLTSLTPRTIVTNYRQVDKVVLRSEHNWHFIVNTIKIK